jgi:hypothetical protein
MDEIRDDAFEGFGDLDVQDDGFGEPDDYTLGVLQELYASNIDVSIRWISKSNIAVKLGDRVRGVVAEQTFRGNVKAAIAWLREKACAHYPGSRFADRYRPPYELLCIPGSPEARAAGCICPSRQPDSAGGLSSVDPRCPEHGFEEHRVIDGELVHVGQYWKRDRPGS